MKSTIIVFKCSDQYLYLYFLFTYSKFTQIKNDIAYRSIFCGDYLIRLEMIDLHRTESKRKSSLSNFVRNANSFILHSNPNYRKRTKASSSMTIAD